MSDAGSRGEGRRETTHHLRAPIRSLHPPLKLLQWAFILRSHRALRSTAVVGGSGVGTVGRLKRQAVRCLERRGRCVKGVLRVVEMLLQKECGWGSLATGRRESGWD